MEDVGIMKVLSELLFWSVEEAHRERKREKTEEVALFWGTNPSN